MRVIVGLGNPGPKYEHNRHNIGFLAVDEIARQHDFGPWRARFQGHIAEGTICGEKTLLLKPSTFMNESGRSVGEMLRFFKLDSAAAIVIYDELDLPPTKIRVKQGGGNGGHNGLRSIDAHCDKDYWRLRIGIGHPGDKSRVSGHVLSDFAKAEWPGFEKLLDSVAGRINLLIADKASDFMSKVAMDIAPPKLAKSPKRDTAEGSKGTPPKKDAKQDAPTKGSLAEQLTRLIGVGKKD
ncbi:MAG: aminoacyl-tRNA hydrolase [Pseudomonadota bacterium]